MSGLGAILTAVVTPFDAAGHVDEAAFVALMAHLAAEGSDGVVVAGTTGEAATLDDEEHLGLIALAVAERPHAEFTIIAGVGSNDTRHAVRMTAAACELGADALLSVNPYYNRPNRRGILAHYAEVSRAADRPIVLYNIPQRTGSDLPNDLLAELAQIEHVDAVKQANNANLALVDGLALYAGNDDILARTLDLGGAGGILSPATSSGRACAGWSRSPTTVKASTRRSRGCSPRSGSLPPRPRRRPRSGSWATRWARRACPTSKSPRRSSPSSVPHFPPLT